MFTTGDFSKITGLSIKALRLYHDAGILVPKMVDPETSYRYYDYQNVERARIVVLLRQMMFSVDDILDLLERCNDDGDALSFFESQRTQLESKIRELKAARSALDRVVEAERQALALLNVGTFRIEEKVLPPVILAGIRMKGRYDDIGKVFGTLGRCVGRHLGGKPFGLFYDQEYKDEGADFEGCFPLKHTPKKPLDGISVRELPGNRAVTLMYQGPYAQVGRTYAKLLGYANERGYKVLLPTREVYVKGPGLIFSGNAQTYLTEIQLPMG